MSPLLEARQLGRGCSLRTGSFGRAVEVRAVDGMSLTLEAGRTLGVVGERGCGKSTTGRLVFSLEPPDEGEVLVEGAPMPGAGSLAWWRLRARMRMVFQDPLGALDRRLTIGRQVEEPLVIHGKRGGSARVSALLLEAGLRADHAQRYPHELSGRQRQRAVLARALATATDLLVCDEPISVLDVSIQAQVMNLLMEIQARRGMAMLFISHDLRAVRQVSHRVAVMYLGRIVEEGVPDDVLSARPGDPRIERRHGCPWSWCRAAGRGRPWSRSGDAAKPLPGAIRAVHRQRLIPIGWDGFETGHEQHHGQAKILPDADHGQRDDRRIGVSQPIGRCAEQLGGRGVTQATWR